MSITLPAKLEQRIQEKVSSGAYRSADEVIQAGLSLLDEKERRLAALRADIQVGIDQAERGEVGSLDMEALIRDLKVRHAGKTPVR